jgi:hypothetical protein
MLILIHILIKLRTKYQSPVVWVCWTRKGRLCLLWFIIGGCGTWIYSYWRSVHSPFHASINANTSFFFAIWFRARARIRWVVLDVSMFILACFYLLKLDLKPTVVGINCFIFYCCKKVNWVRLMSPQFIVLSFILCLIYLG